jgi:hypothetical protein
MTDIHDDERRRFREHPGRAWTASILPKMLMAKALITRRRGGAACSPGLATGMFTAAPLHIIRIIPTQRSKGTIQSREPACREPSATMIIATVSKLPDQIFHYPSQIRHPLFSSLRLSARPLRPSRHQALVTAAMRKNFGDVIHKNTKTPLGVRTGNTHDRP